MPGINGRQKVMIKNTWNTWNIESNDKDAWNIWKIESNDKECMEYMEHRK